MYKMFNMLILVVLALVLATCSVKTEVLTIGLSMDEVVTEQSYNYVVFFKKRAVELGVKTIVRSAGGRHEKQLEQVKAMLLAGVKVLVLRPVDTRKAAEIVDYAKMNGVKVIAYDKLVWGSKIDYYITYDYKRSGQLQSTALLDMMPVGRYAILNGNANSRNSYLLHEGQRSVLRYAIKKREVHILFDTCAAKSNHEDGYRLAKSLLAKVKDSIDVIITSSDAMAGGVVRALQESVGRDGLSLAGRVFVAGIDADSRARRRIQLGLQSVTVYNPVKTGAITTVKLAVALAIKNGEIEKNNGFVSNGLIPVPAIVLPTMLITQHNAHIVKAE